MYAGVAKVHLVSQKPNISLATPKVLATTSKAVTPTAPSTLPTPPSSAHVDFDFSLSGDVFYYTPERTSLCPMTEDDIQQVLGKINADSDKIAIQQRTLENATPHLKGSRPKTFEDAQQWVRSAFASIQEDLTHHTCMLNNREDVLLIGQAHRASRHAYNVASKPHCQCKNSAHPGGNSNWQFKCLTL